MTKANIPQYSATAASNTDVEDIDIAENCAPSGINNAIREIMADLKDQDTGAVAMTSPVATSLTVTNEITANGGIALGDNDKATFGNSDLEIYHDGSHSYIDDVGGTGNLKVRATNLVLQSAIDENYATFVANGAATLFYDNAEKIATSATGINVTGELEAEALHITGTTSSDLVVFESTNSGATDAPDVVLYRNSSTPADEDLLGTIIYRGKNDAAEDVDYAEVETKIIDASDGTEDGQFDLKVRLAGSSRSRLRSNSTETVFNETGQDLDFRVESDSVTDALFVEGSSGNVGIGNDSPSQPLHLTSGGFAYARLNNSSFTGIDIGQHTGGNVYFNLRDNKDQIFQTNNTERMRIDSSGNVGINTSSPSASIDVVSSGTNSQSIAEFSSASGKRAEISTDAQDDAFMYLYDSADAVKVAFRTDGNASYINGGGNVGIGTDSPVNYSGYTTTTIGGTSGGILTFTNGGTQNSYFAGEAGGLVISAEGARYTKFHTNGAERMRIDASGNLLVGKAGGSTASSNIGTVIPQNGTCSINSQANVALTLVRSTPGTVVTFVANNVTTTGSISNTASSTAYNTSSDYRLKENVTGITDGIERVKQLKPSRFNFISDPEKTVDGFIAHESQTVVPESVTGEKDAMRDEEYEVTPAVYEDVVIPAVLDDDGNEIEAERTEERLVTEAVMGTRSVPDYQGIDQSKLVPLLTAALQEAIAKIETLEQRITTLENV